MSMPKESIETEVMDSWRKLIKAMEKSLKILDKQIEEAAEMSGICTDEWCEATEHVIDELSNQLYSISEPRWSSKEDSDHIKMLKRQLRDLYAKYKSTANR